MSWLLLSTGVVIGSIALLAKALDLFLGRNKKENFQRSIQNFQDHFSDAEPRTVILFPMYLVAAFYNKLFGARIFSKKAFYRTLVLTCGLGLATLGINGIIMGQPFGIKTAPWDFAAHSVQIAHEMAAKPELAGNNLAEKYTEWILKLDGPIGKTAYTVFFFLIIILTNSFLNFTTIVLARLFLKEMLESKIGVLPLIMMVATNFFVITCASTLILLLLGVVATPAMWLPYAALFVVSIKSPPVFMILGHMAVSLAWGLCAVWLKIGACIAVIPTAAIAVPVLVCGMGMRLRKQVHSTMIYLIARGLEHDKGFLAFVAAAFTFMGVAIGLLVQIMGRWSK